VKSTNFALKIWSKLKSNNNLRSTLLYTLTSFINQFGSFLVLPLVWKGLQVQDFAVIGLIEAATPFLAGVLTLSTDQYLTRFYYGWKPEEKRSNISKSLTLNFFSLTATGLLSLVILACFYPIIPTGDFRFYVLGLLHIIFYSSLTFPNSLFRISSNTKAYMIFTLSMFVLRLLLNYIFTISMGWGLYGYVLSNTINSFLFFGIVYIYLFSTHSFTNDRRFFRENLAFSLPYVPTNLLGNFALLADRLVLSIYVGKFEAGLLTLGQKVSAITGSLSQAIKLGYVPYISEVVSREKYSIPAFNRYRMMYVAPISATSFFLVLFGADLLRLIGIDVQGVNRYLPLFLLIVYLNSNNLFFSPGLYLSKRSDKMWSPNLLQLAVRFVLYFVLVPRYLLEGVIVASLVASVVSFVHNYYLSEKYYKLNPDFIGIAVQFLPFIITLLLIALGVEIFTFGIWMRVLAMGFYLLILGSYFFLKHDENHPQPV
jgi:O-antigen/teichoic acid export membrane protein